MADEHDIAQVELAADVEHVGGVAVQRAVAMPVVGREVGLAGADIVEQDDAEAVLERRPDVAPHDLVAAEAVREDHRPAIGGTVQLDVVASEDTHDHIPPVRSVRAQCGTGQVPATA